MKKRFPVFAAFFLSFFSGALYRDVATRWRGIAFGYLLLLLLLCWIPPMVKVHRGFSGFLKNDAPAVLSQIPEIRIVNGEASTPENRPYQITDPETGEVFFIVDTTGATTSLDGAPDSVKGLVTRTGAIIEKNEFEKRSFEFKEIQDFTLTREKIEKGAGMVKGFLVPVIAPFAIFGSYIYRIGQALFYSLFGLIFAAILGATGRLPYAALLRLTVVAMTPAIIVKMLISTFGSLFPFSWLVFFSMSMFYLFFGIRSASRETETGVTPPPFPPAP
ncbi:MAG: DUF1189 family protein [Verrucomicrobiae bacterium]|nr:DUF1189 family protein [Verrucomicrobiae bacterium]